VLGIGTVYSIGYSTQILSNVVNNVPAGVTNLGASTPDITIENVLSLIS
jgi:4-hydroxy-3-methylbut-2-enyl diphosphate reductase IspH